MALGGLAGGVELDEFGGDLAHRLLGTALAFLPVRTAHLVQTRGIATDVAGDLVQGVHGHEEPVTGLATPGRGVLDDEVLAGGSGHRTLDHLDVAANPVPFVHDEVASLEFHGLDLVATPSGHPSGGRIVLVRALDEVAGGVDDQVQPLAGETTTLVHSYNLDGGFGGGGIDVVDDGRPDPVLGEQLVHTTCRALTLSGEYDHPVIGQSGGQVLHGSLDVTSPGFDLDELGIDGLRCTGPVVLWLGEFVGGGGAIGSGRVQGERGHGPPRHAAFQRPAPHLGQVAVAPGGQVDRGIPAASCRRPTGVEELLGGAHQIGRSRSHQFWIGQDDGGRVREHVDEQLGVVDERGDEGLHALHGLPLADLLQHVGKLGMIGKQLSGPGAHRVIEDEFPAWRAQHDLVGLVGGALVGNLEGADLLDLVTEEIDAHRVVQDGREDVDDPATYRELATAFHHVDPGVGSCDQLGCKVAEVVAVAHSQFHRRDAAQPGNLGLQQGTHRSHHHGGCWGSCIAHEATEHGHTSPHGVGARAQTFVRQGLPGRVVGHLVGTEPRLQGGGGLLGLPEGTRHQQDGESFGAGELSGEGGRHCWTSGRGHREIKSGNTPSQGVGAGTCQHGFLGQQSDQTIRTHRVSVCATATLWDQWLGGRGKLMERVHPPLPQRQFPCSVRSLAAPSVRRSCRISEGPCRKGV